VCVQNVYNISVYILNKIDDKKQTYSSSASISLPQVPCIPGGIKNLNITIQNTRIRGKLSVWQARYIVIVKRKFSFAYFLENFAKYFFAFRKKA
jgi:hypothetical protein